MWFPQLAAGFVSAFKSQVYVVTIIVETYIPAEEALTEAQRCGGAVRRCFFGVSINRVHSELSSVAGYRCACG